MSSQDVVVTSAEERAKVKNFIDAISEIQQYSAGEEYQSDIPDDFWAWNHDLEFFSLGAKAFIPGFIISFFLMPLSMAVITGMIPVYGGAPKLYDKLFVMAVCFVLMFGVLILLVSASKYVKGRFTCKMVRGLYVGAGTIIIFLGIFFTLIYQIIYLKLTPELLSKLLSWITSINPSKYALFAQFNAAFRMCSTAMLLFTIIGLLTLITAYFVMKRRLNKNQRAMDYLKIGNSDQ